MSCKLYVLASVPFTSLSIAAEAFSIQSSLVPTNRLSLAARPLTMSSIPQDDHDNATLKGCVNMALSVDGFIAGKDGDMDWLNNHPPATDGGDMGFGKFLAEMDVMIMGRNTFDTVVRFGQDMWPYGALPILVWTRNVDNVKIPDWIEEKKSVRAKSAASPSALWKELEATGKYKKAYIDGASTIQSFMEVGLIHEMSLSRIPILLGEGISLFTGKDSITRKLQHLSTESYDNGIVTSKYTLLEK